MEGIIKRLARFRRRHRAACFVFIAAVGVLYITNFVLRAAVYHDGPELLLRDFVLPLGIVAGIYAAVWPNSVTASLLLTHIPRVKLLAVCAPVAAALLACLTRDPYGDRVDFGITVFAMTAMYIAPYALRDVQRACLAILADAAVFVLLAAALGNNTAAMVTVSFTALVLICCLPKLKWFNRWQTHTTAKATVAAVTLVLLLLALTLIEQTGILEAYFLSSLGRPGLGSSDFVNRECAGMLFRAKPVGQTAVAYDPAAVFSHRVLTLVLANAGWLAVIPLLLAMVLVITSGIYLCRQSIAIQYYISVSFLAVIAVQTAGYVLTCCGWDMLLFPELAPFLDGSWTENTLFLLMGVCILPPKQKKLPPAEEPDPDHGNELDALDRNDPDYDEKLEAALDSLPRTREGMEQLWGFVRYVDESADTAWATLLEDYEELMDESFRRTVIARLRSVAEKHDDEDFEQTVLDRYL